MKIITINVPVSYLTQMDSQVGAEAYYPSRSEFIRAALHAFCDSWTSDLLSPTQVTLPTPTVSTPPFKAYRISKAEHKKEPAKPDPTPTTPSPAIAPEDVALPDDPTAQEIDSSLLRIYEPIDKYKHTVLKTRMLDLDQLQGTAVNMTTDRFHAGDVAVGGKTYKIIQK